MISNSSQHPTTKSACRYGAGPGGRGLTGLRGSIVEQKSGGGRHVDDPLAPPRARIGPSLNILDLPPSAPSLCSGRPSIMDKSAHLEQEGGRVGGRDLEVTELSRLAHQLTGRVEVLLPAAGAWPIVA